MKTIIEEKREIKFITAEGEYGFIYDISDFRERCDKIIPYEEKGIGSMTAWLAVYKDDKIICRVPAWKVSIFY